MIESAQGNIFSQYADVCVCTVNCVGVMGKGVALSFKQRYPEMFETYAKQCRDGLWKPGFVSLYTLENGQYALLAATKNHWRNDSQIEWIQSCAEKMFIRLEQIEKPLIIAVPPLGCGNGKLLWQDVKPILEKNFIPSRHNYLLFEPTVI